MEQNLKKFLVDAKKTFKECDAANSWPAKLGGYSLSREKTQDKIIDAAQKIAEIQSKTASKQNQLVALEKTLKVTQDEQKRIVKIREQVQNTINDLRIKKVIEGDDSIVASLNAIEDNMGTLGVNYDDPKIESIIQPDEKTTRDELFKKIMAE
jgi:septal ring factor EnvC (AmiA/AmiB activator)